MITNRKSQHTFFVSINTKIKNVRPWALMLPSSFLL